MVRGLHPGRGTYEAEDCVLSLTLWLVCIVPSSICSCSSLTVSRNDGGHNHFCFFLFSSLVTCGAVDNTCLYWRARGGQRHSAVVFLRYALDHLHPSLGLQALRKQVRPVFSRTQADASRDSLIRVGYRSAKPIYDIYRAELDRSLRERPSPPPGWRGGSAGGAAGGKLF